MAGLNAEFDKPGTWDHSIDDYGTTHRINFTFIDDGNDNQLDFDAILSGWDTVKFLTTREIIFNIFYGDNGKTIVQDQTDTTDKYYGSVMVYLDYVTYAPTLAPTMAPSLAPSIAPSLAPSIPPSLAPSISPSLAPTMAPSLAPSGIPTSPPSIAPTQPPSLAPIMAPSLASSIEPTNTPSEVPTKYPTTKQPSETPTTSSPSQSDEPSESPTKMPTRFPTQSPSDITSFPSLLPSKSPSDVTSSPSKNPSITTETPTKIPTRNPTSPTKAPIDYSFCTDNKQNGNVGRGLFMRHNNGAGQQNEYEKLCELCVCNEDETSAVCGSMLTSIPNLTDDEKQTFMETCELEDECSFNQVAVKKPEETVKACGCEIFKCDPLANDGNVILIGLLIYVAIVNVVFVQ